MSKDKLIIFDTTLRDGEQSPGASMTADEKVRIAKALEKMRVDVIEAGFPIASPGDFDAVQAVARTIKDSTVCGLARALDKAAAAAGKRLPVLIEVNSETDFVARTDEFKSFVHDVAMHIAATNPLALDADGLDRDMLERWTESAGWEALLNRRSTTSARSWSC